MEFNQATVRVNFDDIGFGHKNSTLKHLATLLRKKICVISVLEISGILDCSEASRLSFYSALKNNYSLTTLNLFDNNIGDIGVEHITESLQNRDLLTSLNLGKNNITAIGAKYLSDVLKGKSTLTSLNLQDNDISDTGVERISQLLCGTTSLSILNLQGNRFGERGAKNIAESLLTNTSLTSLNLRDTQISHTGIKHISEALQNNNSLTHLNLNSNKLGDQGIEYLSEALKINTSLTKLDIWNNDIGDEGGKHLVEALKVNKSLTWLDFGFSHICGSLQSQLQKQVDSNKPPSYFSQASEILKSKNPDLVKAMEFAQLSLRKDKYFPAAKLIDKITLLSKDSSSSVESVPTHTVSDSVESVPTHTVNTDSDSAAPPLPNLKSDIALTKLKGEILQSLQEWSDTASSLLGCTDFTELFSQRMTISKFFTAYESELLPKLKELKLIPSSKHIPAITDDWFEIIESLKSTFTLLQSKVFNSST